MRWLLLPLLLVALLAPRAECPVRALVAPPGVTDAAALRTPPLRVGDPLAPLGTDRFGRDAACVLPRALGLWRGWHGRGAWVPELPALLVAALLLGRGSFRLVLAGAVALLTARLVSAQVAAVRREGFVEGAAALGGPAAHILRVHVWPHLHPRLPAVLGSVLSAVFLWLMELGVLGFHDQPTLTVAFTDGLDTVPDVTAVPLNADLGQLISFSRWTWLDTPEGLAWPVLLLTLLTLALKDAVRAGRRSRD
ncbi:MULTISPECIES: hypothetical protein [Deinococcus]|uniref:Uncharacterized protein n=1 Tax=Deinococcus rufus TaxID=2136097 RepID=A0ABV7Z742_9DEIO|nr:hypothetical protein [Deinococcus sp. AB2017081]WQE96360.1 hypothetical protein U2P90_05540 [Deinococcus sp. AB2017081]